MPPVRARRHSGLLNADWVLAMPEAGPYGIDASAHRLLEGALRQRRSTGSVTDSSGSAAPSEPLITGGSRAASVTSNYHVLRLELRGAGDPPIPCGRPGS